MKATKIDKIQEEYRLLFEELEDDFDRYDYLLALSGKMPFMGEEEKTDQLLFKGCQAHIWLKISLENGRLRMNADSDVILVRGMLAILQQMVDGREPKEIMESRLDLFDLPVFEGIIPVARQAGMALLVQEIRRQASRVEENGE